VSSTALTHKPRKGQLTRVRILEAAASVLERDGYAAATLTEIAAVAKMQAGSLYYHFDSKDAIVEEVLRVGVEHSRGAICVAVEGQGPDASGHDQLLAAVAAYVQVVVAESNFTRANIRCSEEAPKAARESLALPLRDFANLWVGLLEKGQRDGSIRADLEPRVIARMTIAALNSCVQWYRPDGDLSVEEVAAMFATSLVDGLAT
jgi:AcrR family transcriptional regulator